MSAAFALCMYLSSHHGHVSSSPLIKLEMEERFEISFKWRERVLCVLIAGRLDARVSDRFTLQTDMAISEARRVGGGVILACSALDHVIGLGKHNVLLLAHKADYLGSLKIYQTMSDAHGSLA